MSITLYQYQPWMGLPNPSPFCMKLETYLRMAQLPFVAPQISLRQMGRAPKGKLPYVRDGTTVLATANAAGPAEGDATTATTTSSTYTITTAGTLEAASIALCSLAPARGGSRRRTSRTACSGAPSRNLQSS